MNRTVSVIIPSYNSAATIGKTIESLLGQDTAELLKEVIVVDSSDDGKTPAMLDEKRSEKVRVVHLRQKSMPAVARNIGAKEASGEILAFIDSDAYAAGDWLAAILRAREAGCRLGGGAILLPEFQADKQVAVAQYFLQFNGFMPTAARRVVKFTPSCNLFCDKKLFEQVGGFPEIRASEDVLFGMSASRSEKFYFDPAVRVYHIFREQKDSYFQNQRMLGRYILIYRRDHLKQGWCRGPLPLLLVPAVVTAKFLGISARVLYYGGWQAFSRYIGALPLFLNGLYFWTEGFLQACLDPAALTDGRDAGADRPGRIDICGVFVDNLSMKEVLEEIDRKVRDRQPCYIVTPNVDHIVRLQSDTRFRAAYEQAALVLADGMPLVWASRFLGTPLKEKVSGSDLMVEHCRDASRRGHKVFFMGGRPGAVEKAKQNLELKYPGLSVVGTYCPPLGFENDPGEMQKIIGLLRRASPDVLYVGVGTPKQENWIHQNFRQLDVPVCIGVGATFDFVSGIVRRAPVFFQRNALEWFWRLAQEPGRLWRRYLLDDPEFFWLVFIQKLRNHKRT